MKDLFADYGGTPNDSSGTAISANNSAIAGISGHGCRHGGRILFQPAVLVFEYDHVSSRKLVAISSLAFWHRRPQPECVHDGNRRRRRKHGNLDYWDAVSSQYPGDDLVLWLNEFVLSGGGIFISNCGKYLRTRNVHIVNSTANDYALEVSDNAGCFLQFNVIAARVPRVSRSKTATTWILI